MILTDGEVSMQEDFKSNDGISKPLSLFFFKSCWEPDFMLCVLFIQHQLKMLNTFEIYKGRRNLRKVIGGRVNVILGD